MGDEAIAFVTPAAGPPLPAWASEKATATTTAEVTNPLSCRPQSKLTEGAHSTASQNGPEVAHTSPDAQLSVQSFEHQTSPAAATENVLSPGAESTLHPDGGGGRRGTTLYGHDVGSSEGGDVVQLSEIRNKLHISDAELQFCRTVFQAYDADGSGTIDLEELGEVMQGLGVMMTRDQLQELLNQVDVDGSDEVDFGEFLQLIALYKEASQYMFFDQADGSMETVTQRHVREALKVKGGLLIPDARWRWPWNLGIMAATMWFAIWTSHTNLHFDYDPHDIWPGLIYFHMAWTLFYAADMVLCSRTVYSGKDGLVERPDAVCMHYLKTWFLPDLLATIPFELLPFPLRYLSWARLIRILKIPSLWQFTHRLMIDEAFIKFHFAVMPMVTIVWWLLLVIHGAVEILLVMQNTRDDIEFNYTAGIYLVIYTLSTVGYGDINTATPGLRLFCCALFIASMMVNGLVIGEITNTLAKADIRGERKDKMRQTLAVMKHFEIPFQLKDEILQFQFHVLEHNLSAAYTELLQGLPTPMQEHLGLYVKIKFISMVKMFQEAHRGCKIALAQALTSVVCCPEQYIIVVGEEGREMYFLGHGFADVLLSDGKHVATIKKGDHFGEVALLEDAKRSASVKALTYCDLFKLDKGSFTHILSKFPAFRKVIEELGRERQQVGKGSDTNSEDMRDMRSTMRSEAETTAAEAVRSLGLHALPPAAAAVAEAVRDEDALSCAVSLKSTAEAVPNAPLEISLIRSRHLVDSGDHGEDAMDRPRRGEDAPPAQQQPPDARAAAAGARPARQVSSPSPMPGALAAPMNPPGRPSTQLFATVLGGPGASSTAPLDPRASAGKDSGALAMRLDLLERRFDRLENKLDQRLDDILAILQQRGGNNSTYSELPTRRRVGELPTHSSYFAMPRNSDTFLAGPVHTRTRRDSPSGGIGVKQGSTNPTEGGDSNDVSRLVSNTGSMCPRTPQPPGAARAEVSHLPRDIRPQLVQSPSAGTIDGTLTDRRDSPYSQATDSPSLGVTMPLGTAQGEHDPTAPAAVVGAGRGRAAQRRRMT
eukprot:TRINITY_DN55607_c0_g1_i1.p1 TRINITY_DN55607_c0_g1~~TRINITY_DN55607_c0_g1_i1.p1  ORF type:complete len:1051 (+),score=353.49 TRINITY_DN55607_c0_g1_i1:107-3259(+)